MGATETPLTDILSQLRARAEAWGREAAAARSALAEEVAHAREALEAQAAELRDAATTPGAAPAGTSMLQEALDAALEESGILQNRLSDAEREIDVLRGRLADVETEHAALQASGEEKVDAAVLAEAVQSKKDAEAVHATAIEALEAKIASLETALNNAGEGKVDADALDAVRAAFRALEDTRREEVEALESRLTVQVATVESLRAEVSALHTAAGRDEAARALAAAEIPAFDAQGHKRRMGDILVEAGLLTREQLEEALAEQGADPHRRFGAIVVERGFTTEEAVARILAAQLRLPYVSLLPGTYDVSAPRLISAHLARLHKALPIRQAEGVLTVAMANPLDLIAIEDIEIASRSRVEPVVATRSGIEALLGKTV